jgi:hypothetical protein
MGVRECVNHGLLAPYAVLSERAGDAVAHVKFTLLLLPTGTIKITGLDAPAGFASRELPTEIQSLLQIDEATAAAERRKLKKKNARKKKANSGATGETSKEEEEA